jgi:hypothetical protein
MKITREDGNVYPSKDHAAGISFSRQTARRPADPPERFAHRRLDRRRCDSPAADFTERMRA